MSAKKSLGQHWLTSVSARNKIIETAELKPKDTVLEIGPGKGFLTEELLRYAGHVIAVEKDGELVNFLHEKFVAEISAGKLELVHADALDYKLTTKSYKLVANIPYYLTGQILRQFLSANNQPTRAVLLVQKEVAERAACSGQGRGVRPKESLLSISVKAYGDPKLIKTVPAGAFHPKPKVDSAILSIDNISRARLAGVNEEKFFSMIKQGFSSRRKQLKNNLSAPLGKCKIKPTARAEELTLQDWLCLCTNWNEI